MPITLELKCGTDNEGLVYHFDGIFSELSSQVTIFDYFRPIIKSIVTEGESICLITCGESGSGKTFTL